MKSVNACISGLVSGPPVRAAPRGGVELLERRVFVEGAAVRLHARSVEAAGAVSPPMIGRGSPSRGTLRAIGPFIGWNRDCRATPDAMGSGCPARGRRDSRDPTRGCRSRRGVTGRARGLSGTRREARVVEKPASGDDRSRLGVVERHVCDLGARRRVDDGDAVVESRGHVEAISRVVEQEPARSTALHVDVIIGVGDEGVVLERRRRRPRPCRGERRHRRGPTASPLGSRRGQLASPCPAHSNDAVVDVLFRCSA